MRSVDRWAARLLESGESESFLARRAAAELERIPQGTERRLLDHVLRAACGASDSDDRTAALLAWAGHLEARGLFPWAAEVVERALRLHPEHPEIELHAARIRRKAGDVVVAARKYEAVASRTDSRTRLHRMARIGLALLRKDAEFALGREMRHALTCGDREAAAVAQEARAGLRAERGALRASLRDFGGAALRYAHPVDLGRIGHHVADLLLRSGQIDAARDILHEVVGTGHPGQAERARSRLRDLARGQNDEVGLRRWANARPSSLVSLSVGHRARRPREPRLDVIGMLERLRRV